MGSVEADSLYVEKMDPKAFARYWRRTFKNGQHVFVVGPTGSGKSVLLNSIARWDPLHSWVILDAKGGDDPSLDVDGFDLIRTWPPKQGDVPQPPDLITKIRRAFGLDAMPEIARSNEPIHVRLGPRIDVYEDLDRMKAIFDGALRDLFARKPPDIFNIIIDEAQIIADPKEGFGLGRRIGPILRTKRYHECSLVLATQYPVWIPKSSHNEARHRFFFRLYEHERLQGAGEIAGDRKRIPDVIQSLKPHEFLYQDAEKRRLIRSRVDMP